jgi:hypothetical protein
MNLLSSGKPLKIKSKHSPLISTFLGHHTDTFATHTVQCEEEEGVLCPTPYIYRHSTDGYGDISIVRYYYQI